MRVGKTLAITAAAMGLSHGTVAQTVAKDTAKLASVDSTIIKDAFSPITKMSNFKEFLSADTFQLNCQCSDTASKIRAVVKVAKFEDEAKNSMNIGFLQIGNENPVQVLGSDTSSIEYQKLFGRASSIEMAPESRIDSVLKKQEAFLPSNEISNLYSKFEKYKAEYNTGIAELKKAKESLSKKEYKIAKNNLKEEYNCRTDYANEDFDKSINNNKLKQNTLLRTYVTY